LSRKPNPDELHPSAFILHPLSIPPDGIKTTIGTKTSEFLENSEVYYYMHFSLPFYSSEKQNLKVCLLLN
jgi:hypothetical protein